MGKIHHWLGAAALFSLGLAHAAAPSYTYDQATACGSWCYDDPHNTKLTDGVLGTEGWALNQGVEWDGWVAVPAVNITFQFNGPATFSSVSVGSTQDRLDDVVLPSFTLWAYQGGGWVPVGSIFNPPSEANSRYAYSAAPHPMYTFDGLNVTTDRLLLSATPGLPGAWIFIDEVTFNSTSPVPEPAGWAMLLTGLGIAAMGRRVARVRSAR